MRTFVFCWSLNSKGRKARGAICLQSEFLSGMKCRREARPSWTRAGKNARGQAFSPGLFSRNPELWNRRGLPHLLPDSTFKMDIVGWDISIMIGSCD